MALPASLLFTKLYRPRLRPGLVPRPGLLRLLDEGLRRQLILLSAPGGFGKSLLLSAWANQPRLRPLPLGWLSLDPEENDPARFWRYVAAALDQIAPGVGARAEALLRTENSARIEALLLELINTASQVQAEFVLVLDDYHFITNEAIHRSLSFLLEHMPPQMHLVLSTRVDPPLSLARLRAAGELLELRTRELRFSEAEVAQFSADLGLSSDEVTLLTERTEGWIAGLQMAALSLSGNAERSRLVASFSGSHHYVVDYLLEEVLQRQTPEVQRFLLYTSVLQRLSADLCAALTQAEGAPAILSYLEQANLFLIPLDDGREWYRYHHLFAEMLRVRLDALEPGLAPTLHQRASDWYAARGQGADAVSHAIAAGLLERAAALIEPMIEPMLAQGEQRSLQQWLDELPSTQVEGRPRLALILSQLRFDAGEIDESARLLSFVTEPNLAGEAAVLQARIARARGQLAAAIEIAEGALATLPAEALALRGALTLQLAGALHQSWAVEAAARSYAEAGALSLQIGDWNQAATAFLHQARILVAQGALTQAERLYEQALRLTAEQGARLYPARANACFGLAQVHFLRHQASAAAAFSQEAIHTAQATGNLEVEVHGHIQSAFIAQAMGDPERAGEMIRTAVALTPAGVPYAKRMVAGYQASLQLLQGDLSSTASWEVGIAAQPAADLLSQLEIEPLTLLRLRIAQGDGEGALQALAPLAVAAEQAGLAGIRLELLVLKALALSTLSQHDAALLCMAEALTLAAPERYVRPFHEGGGAALELLRALPVSGPAALLRHELMATLPTPSVDGAPRPHQESRASAPLFEPLSEREMAVLRLLAEGAANQAIADQLFIALTTVKKHMSNIFGKLGVSNRVQALKRANERGLL